MTKLLSVVEIHDSICRLNLSAFHPHAYPLAERRMQLDVINDSINDLYDLSAIDLTFRFQLLDLALHAYIHGGL